MDEASDPRRGGPLEENLSASIRAGYGRARFRRAPPQNMTQLARVYNEPALAR